MPTEVAVIAAGIILVFIVYAGVLAWADHCSASERQKKRP